MPEETQADSEADAQADGSPIVPLPIRRGPGRPAKSRWDLIPAAEFEAAFRTQAQCVIQDALERLRAKVRSGEMTGSQLSVALGILHDKIDKPKPQGPSSLHLHLHGKDRKELLAAVLGNAASRLKADNPKRVSQDSFSLPAKAKGNPPAAPGAVIDVPADPGPSVTAVDSKSPEKQ